MYNNRIITSVVPNYNPWGARPSPQQSCKFWHQRQGGGGGAPVRASSRLPLLKPVLLPGARGRRTGEDGTGVRPWHLCRTTSTHLFSHCRWSIHTHSRPTARPPRTHVHGPGSRTRSRAARRLGAFRTAIAPAKPQKRAAKAGTEQVPEPRPRARLQMAAKAPRVNFSETRSGRASCKRRARLRFPQLPRRLDAPRARMLAGRRGAQTDRPPRSGPRRSSWGPVPSEAPAAPRWKTGPRDGLPRSLQRPGAVCDQQSVPQKGRCGEEGHGGQRAAGEAGGLGGGEPFSTARPQSPACKVTRCHGCGEAWV